MTIFEMEKNNAFKAERAGGNYGYGTKEVQEKNYQTKKEVRLLAWCVRSTPNMADKYTYRAPTYVRTRVRSRHERRVSCTHGHFSHPSESYASDSFGVEQGGRTFGGKSRLSWTRVECVSDCTRK